LPQESLTPLANLPPVLLTGGNLQFAAGIVDTGGKFATGINNTSETDVQNFAAGVINTGIVDTCGVP
jgi:hypothetical protein